MRGLSGHDFHKSVFSYRRKKMKKLFNSIGSVLLTTLLFTGFVFTSCEQTTETQASLASLARLSTLNSVNPPTALESWTPLPNYASEGGGGGHSIAGNGVFLSANWNDGSLGYSTNGQAWSKISSTATTFGSNYIKNLAYLNNTFWAVGQNGNIATSTDGQTWTKVTQTFTNATIYGVAYGNGLYMFVTDARDTTTSASSILVYDGTRFTQLQNNPYPKSDLNSVVSAGNYFVIVGDNGYILYTGDKGASWSTTLAINPDGTTNGNMFKMVAFNGTNTLVASSRYGVAFAYVNTLSNWLFVNLYPSSSYGDHLWLNCVMWDGGRFITAGQYGAMGYSTNGVNWTVDANYNNANSWTKGLFYNAKAFINGVAFKAGRPAGVYITTGGDSSPLAAYTTTAP
jgi:hypothetical protein